MRTTLTAASVVLLACGGGGGSVELAELGNELAEASCSRSFECCDAAELMEQYGFFDIETEAECVTVIAGFTQQFLVGQLEASVASGRVVYHADRMGACLDLMRSMSCEELATSMNSELVAGLGCDDPFEGTVANGSACASDEECTSDFCDGESMDFEGNVTEGTCAAAPGAGTACSEDYECAEGAWCDVAATDGPTCAAPQAAGADCSSDDECASGNCAGDDNARTCSDDLVCDGV